MEQQSVTIPGLCECGCGQATKLNSTSQPSEGYKKGQPRRFVFGHHNSVLTREQSNAWKGGRIVDGRYAKVWLPDHPRSSPTGYVLEHIVVAEKALGKSLPLKAVVHHISENSTDNANQNLVICENQAFHLLLHQRLRALRACGNPNWRKCVFCKEYDDPKSLLITKIVCHKKCLDEYNRRYRLVARANRQEKAA